VSKVAVYPGTFDPVTNGHLDLASRGRSHFDRLILSVLSHDEKQPVFTVAERMGFLRDAVRGWDNVEVITRRRSGRRSSCAASGR